MAQNQKTGEAANDWGRATAPKIAEKIGARMSSGNSNECKYKKKRAVIKCAGPRTTSVGVTYQMLSRLDLVIGAFQFADGSYRLRQISCDLYKENMRETRSKGPSRKKVGKVSRSIFMEKGTPVGAVQLD